MSAEPAGSVRVAGVAVSNPGKVWWPDDGITKLDLARFYERMYPRLSGWLRDRPLTAERCPEGMRGECFFQKNFAKGLPAGVPTFPIRAASGKVVNYVVGGSKQTLIALANLGCIAIHVMNARTESRDHPDWLAFDLDPSSDAFADAAKAGLVLRGILEELGLRSYPKTSGARGLHIFVPLRLGASHEQVRGFALAVGEIAAQRAPSLVTTEFSKRARGGRVFADAMRNAAVQTIVPPYAVRRRPKAPVSIPLEWDEVTPRLDPSRFNIRSVERRLASVDPWAEFWRHRQGLPKLEASMHRIP